MVKGKFSIVGRRMPDVAGIEKVTGAAKFVSDIVLPGMLIGKILHSPYAHARIIDIDPSKAEKLPGIRAVLTWKDVPQNQYTGTLMNWQSYSGIEGFGVYDRRILSQKVLYVGDAVAAVAAINEKVAEEALELIKVKYEVLPAVFDESEAMKESAPKIHDSVLRRQANEYPGPEPVEKNLAVHVCHKTIGNVEEGLKRADYIVEETAYSSKQKQAQLETFTCIANFDANSRLTIWSQIQLPHLLKRAIAQIFDMPVGNVRIKGEYIGGAFGAGLAIFREPIAIMLAKKTGKPVKLLYSRQEEFADRPTRAEFGPYTLKMGVKKDGTITAIERKAITRAGAHVECAALSFLIASSAANPLYRRQSYSAEADAVYTNKVPCGAMRGFGNPEDTFIREQVMDEAAEKIGLDPVEFRLKNLCQIGDPGTFGPDFPLTSIGLAECLKTGAERIGWKQKHGQKKKGTRRRGVGVSCMAHNSGAWPVHIEHSNALIKFNEDGTVVLTVSPPPMGTNSYSSLAQVAAEVLGISFNDVKVVWGDTDITLFEIGSHASRTMYIIGNCVKKAAEQARDKLLARASKRLEVSPDKLDIQDKQIFVKSNPSKRVPLAEVTKKSIYDHFDVEEIIGQCSHRPIGSPPPYQGVFTEVEVDTETGEVKVLDMVIANDSGRMINPMIVEGQLEGGAAQGLGYTLWEEPIMDMKTGQTLTDDFDTYKIPCALDMPKMEIIPIEQPEPSGPFGAKSVGEPGCVNQAASIANAIYDAIGIRFWSLPITPEKVRESLKAKKANKKTG